MRLVYEWPPPWGGLTPGPYEMTAVQAQQGHHIRYLCGGWPRRPVTQVRNVHVRRLPSALPKLSLFATTAPLAWASLLAWHQWADIIHGHQHLPIWYHVWRRMLSIKKPYVLHLHVTAAGREAQTVTHGISLDFWTRCFEWPLHKFSDRLGCQVADAILCVSHSVRQEAIQYYGADPSKLHVVSNGVNTAWFTSRGKNMRAQLGLAETDKVILYVGSLSKRKQPTLLLNTLAHLLPQWKLLLVGDGPLKAELHHQAETLNVQTRVIFAGYVPYPELPVYYRSADVFALLAQYEGFPKVVLEALASGVPVVATPSFAVDEILRPFFTIVQSKATVIIAQAIADTAEIRVDEKLIQHHYSWPTKVQEIEAIYEQFI